MGNFGGVMKFFKGPEDKKGAASEKKESNMDNARGKKYSQKELDKLQTLRKWGRAEESPKSRIEEKKRIEALLKKTEKEKAAKKEGREKKEEESKKTDESKSDEVYEEIMGTPGGTGGGVGAGNINVNTNTNQNNVTVNLAQPATAQKRAASGPRISEAEDTALIRSMTTEYTKEMNAGLARLAKVLRKRSVNPDIIPSRAYANVRAFKQERIVKYNKRLAEKGSQYRVTNTPDGTARLMTYKLGETPPDFGVLNPIQQKEIMTQYRKYIKQSKSRTPADPTYRVNAMNVALAKRNIRTVRFETPIRSSDPSARLIEGDPALA